MSRCISVFILAYCLLLITYYFIKHILHVYSVFSLVPRSLNAPSTFNSAEVAAYLEDLGEESRADLLAEEVVDASQTGHGAPQGSVRGRADPVGRVDAVERRLVRTAGALLGIAEAVHGAGATPRSRSSVLSREGTRRLLGHGGPEARGDGDVAHYDVITMGVDLMS